MHFFLIGTGILFVFLLILLLSVYFTVPQNQIFIIERFGKFHKLADSGLNMRIPFIDTIKGKLILQVLYHNVILETKTNDNVFVEIHCSIQYRVLKNKAFEAYYSLDDPVSQLESYVFDTIRGTVPKLTIDNLFEEKDQIAQSVKNSLDHVMHDFGIEIIKTLITHIDPAQKVKAAMNEINAAERERKAAQHRAEAEKLVIIKAAEAQKESRILQGEGVAGQRKAIIHGLRESLNELKISSDPNSNITEQEAINLLLVNQYFDTLKDIGAHSKSNAIFLNHNSFDGDFLSNNKDKDSKKNILEAILSADIVRSENSENKKN
ncbi:SPFH domain-containing protein [Alphaproteobacteria bacterium endosymbiont of Tiliacea citrago]|uniref:SPFH domain-containing protein n=1 Tax=Alphaproteobacteria bacterium endosymbiont of Tiliacea citrago TaxID=3077944 RepID=UPI00313E78A2